MYGNNGICILLVAFTEITGLAWVYGIDRFFDNIKSMIGYYPSALLKCCMRFADPVIIMVSIYHSPNLCELQLYNFIQIGPHSKDKVTEIG